MLQSFSDYQDIISLSNSLDDGKLAELRLGQESVLHGMFIVKTFPCPLENQCLKGSVPMKVFYEFGKSAF